VSVASIITIYGRITLDSTPFIGEAGTVSLASGTGERTALITISLQPNGGAGIENIAFTLTCPEGTPRPPPPPSYPSLCVGIVCSHDYLDIPKLQPASTGQGPMLLEVSFTLF